MDEAIDKKHERLAYRLADILRRLNEGERIVIDDLAETYKTNRRTIERDLNERLAFLPWKRENGSYELEGFYLGKLNPHDIRHFATLAGVAGMFPSLDHAFLRNLLDGRVSAVYDIKGVSYEDVSLYQRLMEILKEAILTHRQFSCLYDAKPRLLFPYRLIHHHGRWYLAAIEKAFSLTKVKVFRLAKIEQGTLLDASFELDPAVLTEVSKEDSVWFGEKTEVILTVAPEVASHFLSRPLFPDQQILKELADGSLLVSSRIAHDTQIVPIVRYWIPHVRVISPESVKEACMDSVRRYVGIVD